MSTVSPIPSGQTAITPNIVVEGGPAALDFYRRAFGAEVVYALEHGGKVMHAELRIAGCVLTLADSMPEYGVAGPDPAAPASCSLTLWTADSDALFARAVEAGATALTEPADQFHGDRTGTLRCPFGHRWIIATHVEDVAPDELRRRMDQWLASA